MVHDGNKEYCKNAVNNSDNSSTLLSVPTAPYEAYQIFIFFMKKILRKT